MNASQFIAAIAPSAMSEWQQNGVAASLTIAQAALESNWGSSELTRRANNLFGIKGQGPAGSVVMPTTEYRNGVPGKENASFRKYDTWAQSISDHTRLLRNKRYAAVLNRPGKEAAYAVAKAGYATDPKYAAKLISLMDKYNLYQYDKRKGDEPMTAEERKLVDTLQETVRTQSEQIAKLEQRANIPMPAWAKEAVEAALEYDQEHPLINNPEMGSYDFYRFITIMHRRGLFSKGGAGE